MVSDRILRFGRGLAGAVILTPARQGTQREFTAKLAIMNQSHEARRQVHLHSRFVEARAVRSCAVLCKPA
eukprot:173483-Prymnesium_polylepis.1